MIVQKLRNISEDSFNLAKRYYRIIFALNDIHVTESELNLIVFSALHGTISTPPVRNEFIKKFNTPINSIYNMSSKLQKRGIFVKENDEKVRVNPAILPGFKDDLTLVIKLENGNK